MAYTKEVWTDRDVQYPNRYKDQNNNVLILTRDEGTVNEAGTLFNAAKMNNIEDGISDQEEVIGNKTDTYSASSTYALGSLVIYGGLLYKCTTAITVAEAWTIAHWTQVSLTSLAQSGDVYSKTERKTNKIWIDGKPIYRKTLSFTDDILPNTLLTKAHGIDNIATQWIDNSATFFRANSTVSYSLPVIGYNSNLTEKIYCYSNATNIYIYANGGWNTGWTKVITLCYTKTTD